jgi:streptogrisin C
VGVVRASGATPKLVARSETELVALGAKLDNLAKKDPKNVPAEVTGWVVDPLINRIRIEVLPGGHGAGLRFATAAGLGAGEFEYTTMPGSWTQRRDVKAGQEFFPVHQGFSLCSTGFAVTAFAGTPFARPRICDRGPLLPVPV